MEKRQTGPTNSSSAAHPAPALERRHYEPVPGSIAARTRDWSVTGPLDATLVDRLVSVGLEPNDFGDPGEAWRRLRERFGGRITLVDRYALEAAHRGAQFHHREAASKLSDGVAVQVRPITDGRIKFL